MGLRRLPLFRWIDGFMKWPPVIRLPFILTILLIVSLTLWAGGAGIVELVGLVLVVAMSGAIVAVLVILAQGAHRDAWAAGINPDLIVIEQKVARRFTPVTIILGLIVPFWFSFTYNGDLLQWLAIVDPDYVERTPWGLIGTDWLGTKIQQPGEQVLRCRASVKTI